MAFGLPFLSYQGVKTLCLALAVEALLLAGMAALLLSAAPVHQEKPPTVLQLSLKDLDIASPVLEPQPEPVPTPKPPEPEPVKKPPEPEKPPEPVALPPPPAPVPKPKSKPVPEKFKTTPATQQVSPSSSTADSAFAEAEQVAAAAAAAQAQSKQSADLLDAYRSKVNAAIQAAVSCPLAAQNMGMSGQTKVHFDLTDGVQSNATVATTSKRPMLDSAALAAVQNARYPAPPKEFAGQKKTMSVLVVLNCAN